MDNQFLRKLNTLKNLDTNDITEIVVAVFAMVNASFNALADKRITVVDATYLLPVFGPIQLAIDNGSDASRELAIISNEDFDQVFDTASANFDLEDEELEDDIRGLTKGVLHGYRMIARTNARKQAA